MRKLHEDPSRNNKSSFEIMYRLGHLMRKDNMK